MNEKKKGKGMFIFICILVFIFSFIIGMASKSIKPAWSKKYSVEWNDEIGTLKKDISYGDKESNKFDLYLPKDNSKSNYGLVVYIHAGGFTSGDKTDDIGTFSWLCSKGYVACGINYTLRSEENANASVLTQSNEIKQAMPVVIEEARKLGYNINEMAVSGGSAGGCLAMLYAYRDNEESPVPIKMMFEMVGPSSFYVEDWGIYGIGQDTDESRVAGSILFSAMSGNEITPEMIESKEYEELMKPISAYSFVNKNSVPSVLLYGKMDKIQPYAGVRHLEKALKDNNIDYKLFIAPHSGHGVQNDNKIMKEYMETVEKYLNKYIPVK